LFIIVVSILQRRKAATPHPSAGDIIQLATI